MANFQTDVIRRHDVVTIPVIWVAFVLSLLFHGAMMWTWLPKMRALSIADVEHGDKPGSLVARLAPRPTPPESSPPARPPARPLQAQPSPARRATPPPAPTRPRPAPPPVEPSARAPEFPLPPTVPSVAPPSLPAPTRAPPEGDLASYIEARRRARGEPTAAASQGGIPAMAQGEDDNERRNRVVAANLASINAPTFGQDARIGGGIFQIKRLGYDDGEFYFNGWSKDIGRKARQVIEVRRGDNSDIRIAMIRRMIAIIREQQPGDFVWISQRLGREIVLSARPGDNAGLEEFMMREFFSDARQPY